MTPLLQARHVVKRYPLPRRGFEPREYLVAVDDVSIDLGESEFVALVGESGSGKSTMANVLAGLITPDSGDVAYLGQPVNFADKAGSRSFRQNVQMVFQDPFSSLDPRLTVRQSLIEPLKALGVECDFQQRCREAVEAVGLSVSALDRYPHAFSGGQRQRIAIARALAPRPTVILADEPVSALDVSVQAQVLNLLLQLRADFGLSILLIAHDLAVVEQVSDRVLVMQRGRIVEGGTPAEIFGNPRHPYTRSLLSAVLNLDGEFPYADLAAEPDPEPERKIPEKNR